MCLLLVANCCIGKGKLNPNHPDSMQKFNTNDLIYLDISSLSFQACRT